MSDLEIFAYAAFISGVILVLLGITARAIYIANLHAGRIEREGGEL